MTADDWLHPCYSSPTWTTTTRRRSRRGWGGVEVSDPWSLAKAIVELEKQMKAAAKRLEFEEAAAIRDRIKELRAQQIYKT
jgi:excinuclease UvrABC helicase subunit UvrB